MKDTKNKIASKTMEEHERKWTKLKNMTYMKEDIIKWEKMNDNERTWNTINENR